MDALMQRKKTLALIPARGGSKGVPRKNLRNLAGKPLISWTIETALSLKCLDRVIVTTDDEEIAATAKHYGAEVPFIRPAELAQDKSADFPVALHALTWLLEKEKYRPDILVWLRPTVPLRSAEDIKNAVQLLIDRDAECVRSVCLTSHHPYWMKRIEHGKLLPLLENTNEENYVGRQSLPSVYILNGAVDVTWCSRVLTKRGLFNGNMMGYIMPQERSVDIDSEMDLMLAEILIRRQKDDNSKR